MTDREPTLEEQIEACERAAERERHAYLRDPLRAAAKTLRELQAKQECNCAEMRKRKPIMAHCPVHGLMTHE